MLDESRLIEIYRARNLPEAFAIRTALDAIGVNAFVDGEMLQNALGDLPMGWNTAPRVRVLDSDVEAAQAIIEKVFSSYPEQELSEDVEPNCLACGHKMATNELNCTACGWTYSVPDEESSVEA